MTRYHITAHPTLQHNRDWYRSEAVPTEGLNGLALPGALTQTDGLPTTPHFFLSDSCERFAQDPSCALSPRSAHRGIQTQLHATQTNHFHHRNVVVTLIDLPCDYSDLLIAGLAQY